MAADATGTVKHRFVNPVADAGSPTETGPDEWNDSEVLAGGSEGQVPLRRVAAGDGWMWGTLGSRPADVSTGSVQNSGTGETDLMSHVVPANRLNVNGRSVRFRFGGVVAGNANAKTIKFYFGTASITLNPTTTSPNGLTWEGEVDVIRTGSNAQLIVGKFRLTGLPNEYFAITTATETDTAVITVKVTGQSDTASADITQRYMLPDYKG